MPIDLTKSLTQLENDDWGEDPQVTGLISRCYKARKIPLKDLSVENLRLLIGQNISARILVPLALERLQTEPFISGDFYPGDLLASVIRLPMSFWDQHSDLKRTLNGILKMILEDLAQPLSPFEEEQELYGIRNVRIDPMVLDLIHQFQSENSASKHK